MSIFDLAWLIPLFPALACGAILLFAHRERKLSHQLAIGGIAISCALSQVVFWAAVLYPASREGRAFESIRVHWLSAGLERFTLGVYVDPLAAVMLFTLPLVCLMISIYSVGYMGFGAPEASQRYSRFFAYVSLSTTAVLGMVAFNNLLTSFICWEIMDACSYLLIGFWQEKKSATQAALKSFLVTKVGDLFLILGLVLLYSQVGSLAYRDIFDPQALANLAQAFFPGTGLPMATVIALLLFGGTVGKSALFPLHVWLPDAVECPAPVLALIHAATTVPAGVFLLVRTFPILAAVEGGIQMAIVAAMGALTAIFASVVAIAQNDIRRALACLTISQSGYMVAALGLGAYVAGAFHLIAHLVFGALLCLGAGSVIHGMEQGRREQAPRDRRKSHPHDLTHMGGLARRMPRTFWTSLVGGLALSGFPLVTASLWPKASILARAYELTPAVFWVLAVAAGLTAFSATRLICLTFAGWPRTGAAQRAPESEPAMTGPLIALAILAVGLGWAGVPEHLPVVGGVIPNWFHRFVGSTIGTSPAATHSFTWQPLALGVAFALGGLVLGWLVYGWKPMGAGEMDRVETAMRKVWLGRLYSAMRERFYLDKVYQAISMRGVIPLADLCDTLDRDVLDGLVTLAGRFGRAASRASDWLDARVVDAWVNLVGRAARGLSQASEALDLRVLDRVADLTGQGARALSDLSAAVDRRVVDGAVQGVSDTVKAGGRFIRPIQTGRVQNYLLIASLMLLTLVVAFLMILFLKI